MTNELPGAWLLASSNEHKLLQFVDGYYTQTLFCKASKKFIETQGGSYNVDKNLLTLNIEFNTGNHEQTGTVATCHFSIKGDELTTNISGEELAYKKLDNVEAPLAGVWHITSQMREGKVVPIHRTGTRKTLKILSGTRFQWMAIDTGTKEFFGSGGGIYQFVDGKYTEEIEFFSKDGSRVGTALTFDGKLENGEWHHSGRSSKGENIYEIWSRVNP